MPANPPTRLDEETRAYSSPPDRVLELLGVDRREGLTVDEAERRLREHGPNQLHSAETRHGWQILVAQLDSVVVYLLGAAAVLAFATQRAAEGIALVAVIAVNTAIGFVSEWKSVRSMAALRQMGEHDTRVRRGGQRRTIGAAELVPGDIVLLESGDLVPADSRLIETAGMRINEAPLTGESVPVDKLTDALAADTELADRRNMIFKGTRVVEGRAEAIVVATGVETELGRISELTEQAEAAVTPLQKRLDRLGRRIAALSIAVAAAVAAVGLLVRRGDTTRVIETALAVGVAAVPEGLPIVATISLARGMYLMAKRNALVKRLAAVETLGATRVIFTDKTGTLTENRMSLRKVVTPEEVLDLDSNETTAPKSELADRLMRAAVLCNGASLRDDGGAQGDPTEIALLRGGREMGLVRDKLVQDMPQARVEDFDPRTKKMATFHEQEGRYYVAVKGAPGAVIEVCDRIAVPDDSGRDEPLDEECGQSWRRRSDELAGEGLRLLAVADKVVDAKDAQPYEGLCFVGLVGLLDPPRQGVKSAIDRCQEAGIRVEMVTGDQAATAGAIAAAVGIVGGADDPEATVMHGRELRPPDELDEKQRQRIYDANIFARVSPEQKLNLVRVYQDEGEVVAMTGDGINDAPALKKADISVVMGMRGTEAAKQAGDMILTDDAFETIVAAVEQGRITFGNIRKSVMFILCTNVAEVLAVVVATIAGWTLPLRPLQILYLNVLTDVLPALALGVGPGTGTEMNQSPRRPEEAVLNRGHWLAIGAWATLICACVLSSLLLAQHWLGLGELEAVTVSFLTLGFSKLWFTFNLRAPGSRLMRNEITLNPWVWGSIALCVALLVAAAHLPGLNSLLQTQPLDRLGWALLLGASSIPFVLGQCLRELQRVKR